MKEAFFVGFMIVFVLAIAGIVYLLSYSGVPTWVCVLAAVILSVLYGLVVTRGAILSRRTYR